MASSSPIETGNVVVERYNHSQHHIGKHHHFKASVQSYLDMYIGVCASIPNCGWKGINVTAPPSYELVSSILDENDRMMFLAIEFRPEKISGIGLLQLDYALAERPWWWAVVEMLTPERFVIVVQHTPPTLTAFHQSIAQRMYPRKERCETTPLAVSNHPGDTWGIRWTVAYESDEAIANSIVYHIFVRSMQRGHDSATYFTSSEDCPHYANKWECLFLTTTNCSIPQALIDCKDDGACYPGNLNLYSNATRQGIRLTDNSEEMKQIIAKRMEKNLLPRPPDVVMQPFKVFKPRNIPNFISLDTADVFQRNTNEQLNQYLYYLGVATRFNSFFRMKIQQIASNFRHSFDPPFLENSTCVALHIRQDDRNIPGVTDLDAWCDKCSIINEQGRRSQYNGSCKLYDETDWFDKGCASRLPFGKASLVHFVNSTLALDPTVRNVFIMTDDIDWFHAQKHNHSAFLEALHRDKGIKLYPFPVRPQHRRMALQGAEDFWASVLVAQQCSGFVGHFGSAATQIIYRSLCYFSNHQFLRCPNIFDIGGVF